MKLQKVVGIRRRRRGFRVRNRVRAAGRLRLTVFRSNKHIYAQIIDDATGATIASAGTVEADFRQSGKTGGNRDAAQTVGKLIAERAIAKGVQQVAFDRGPYRYHGRVQTLADAAREAGLDF